MGETDRYSLSDYLNQYRKTSTKKIYFTHARSFFKQIYPELETEPTKLDELSKRYVTKQHDYKGDLIRFRDKNSGNAPKTLQLKLQSVLNFLKYNEIMLPPSFTKNLVGVAEVISEEHVPTQDELRKICEYLPLNAKTLTLFLSSSGCRIGEALQIKIGDLELDKAPAKVRLRFSTTKTNRGRWTYISTEAKVLLEEWLGYREEYLKQSVMRTKGIVKNRVVEGDDRVFPFTDDLYYLQWRTALRKAGLLKVDVVTGRLSIHIHVLRKYFRTRGGWVNPEVPEMLMGHISGVRGVYARYDQAEEVLAKAYLRAEPNLSLYEGSRTVSMLREKVEKQSDDIQQLVVNLSIRNAKLENDLKVFSEQSSKMWSQNIMEFMKKSEELVGRIGELEGQVDGLAYQLEQEHQRNPEEHWELVENK